MLASSRCARWPSAPASMNTFKRARTMASTSTSSGAQLAVPSRRGAGQEALRGQAPKTPHRRDPSRHRTLVVRQVMPAEFAQRWPWRAAASARSTSPSRSHRVLARRSRQGAGRTVEVPGHMIDAVRCHHDITSRRVRPLRGCRPAQTAGAPLRPLLRSTWSSATCALPPDLADVRGGLRRIERVLNRPSPSSKAHRAPQPGTRRRAESLPRT